MCYVNQDLTVKIVTSYKFPKNLEVLPVKIILGKRKILLLGLCRPSSYSENAFSSHMEIAFSHYTTTYNNITLIGDFNMNADKNKFLNNFLETFNLKNLINEPTCFKLQNPSIIDLILSNCSSSFMKTAVLETDIKS